MRDLLANLAAVIRNWFVNPRCPWCGEHTSNLEAHYATEHAGDDLLAGDRLGQGSDGRTEERGPADQRPVDVPQVGPGRGVAVAAEVPAVGSPLASRQLGDELVLGDLRPDGRRLRLGEVTHAEDELHESREGHRAGDEDVVEHAPQRRSEHRQNGGRS